MKIGIYLAHPAHYNLFKNVIPELVKKNDVLVLYNDKDILHNLILNSSFKNISQRLEVKSRHGSKLSLLINFIKKLKFGLLKFSDFKPELILGTSIIISFIAKIIDCKSIILNEDDFDIIKITSYVGYPFANYILCPSVCRTIHFDKKSIKYDSYHELAYLHPNHFIPNELIASKYVNIKEPYFIIRLARLSAHHDHGIRGIDNNLLHLIINLLSKYGRVYITNERKIGMSLTNI